jgi:NAD(P)H-dependent FMN reductase
VNVGASKPDPRDSVAAHIVGLAGSLRVGSTTQKAVRWALLGAQQDGAQTRLLDLAAYDLPFLGRDQEPKGRTSVERFLADLRAADGVVLGSPEIHGSMSGVLKNALDLADRDVFEGKMLGLIGVAGGRLGASEDPESPPCGRALAAYVGRSRTGLDRRRRQGVRSAR